MYLEKMEPILQDLEDKELEIAGGSVVGIVLGTVNSLIKYIANLSTGKKKYDNVQDEIKRILVKAEELKIASLQAIDKDKQILEEILISYKARNEDEIKYQQICKKATEFCMEVLNIANDTYKLTIDISKVGNRMLESDFKICKYYAIASVRSATENVYINLKPQRDQEYINNIKMQCENILKEIES